MEHDLDRGTLPAAALQTVHVASPRAAADEMPFRGYCHNHAGVYSGVYCQPVAWLGRMGLFWTYVQSFRTDMPAVFGDMVLYNNSCGGFKRIYKQAFCGDKSILINN